MALAQKQPTMKEIAMKLNIAVSTVSRALRDHQSIGLGTKIKVRRLAEEWKYECNERAIYFKKGKSFTIGAILPDLSEPFFAAAMTGIEDAADRNGYAVIVGQSHNMADREKQIAETMKNHQIDGLVVSLSKNSSTYEHFDSLKSRNIPVVFFDRVPEQPNNHYIACNMESATMKVIDFLVEKNHRIIGMINGPENLSATGERAEGYRKAMENNKLPFEQGLIVTTDLTAEGTRRAMDRLLSQPLRPTGIIAFNDYVAGDAMDYARSRKLRINKDICFVGFSNLPVSSYWVNPPIASVEQFPYLQGQKAIETLLYILDEGSKGVNDDTSYRIILESHLVVHK